MANILITEDNAALCTLIRAHLKRAGYSVYVARHGVEALDVLDRVHIHLLISDIMMPDMDGYELTSELREAGINIPVLIISAKDALDDKREGFRRGADDYMTKPIDFDELLLRIEALLRRCNMQGAGVMRVGGCLLDAGKLSVTCGGAAIDLRQKEFLLLQKLLSYPEKIFTRQNLMDEIWGYDSESDPRTVDTHIKRLRDKLESVPDFEIQTVRGLGYKAVLKK